MHPMATDSSEGGGPLYPRLTVELGRMFEVDQAMRTVAMNGGRWDAELDRRHTARLKEIVAEIGWPTRTRVGEAAAHHAWLLAQHATHDLAFQKDCLRLMGDAAPGEVSPADVAYLEDRIAMLEDRPQRYGTQFRSTASGEQEPFPIEEPEQLDDRRRAVGLGPFEDYRNLMRATDKRTLTTRTVGHGLRCPFCGARGDVVPLLVVGPQKTAICPTCTATAAQLLEGALPPDGWRLLRPG